MALRPNKHVNLHIREEKYSKFMSLLNPATRHHSMVSWDSVAYAFFICHVEPFLPNLWVFYPACSGQSAIFRPGLLLAALQYPFLLALINTWMGVSPSSYPKVTNKWFSIYLPLCFWSACYYDFSFLHPSRWGSSISLLFFIIFFLR